MGASRGFPSSTSHLFLHATACRLRRTSTPLPTRVLLCCLRWTINPSASAKTKSRSCTSTSGCATTPAAYRILCLRFARLVHHSFGSATDARLDTGGWLTLTRQGLSPRKMRRALLGAKWHLLKRNKDHVSSSRHSGEGRTKALSALNAQRAARRVSEANNPRVKPWIVRTGSRPSPG